MDVDDIDEDETDWNSTDLAQPAPPRELALTQEKARRISLWIFPFQRLV